MERDGLGGGYRTQWSLEGSDGNEKVAGVSYMLGDADRYSSAADWSL